MEQLIKKIQELRDLIKAIKTAQSPIPALAPIKKPSMPSVKATNTTTKIPGVSPTSNKDPKKVAEQLKNAKMQKQKMPLLKYDSNGQWKLEE